jgi:microcystin-dependent protein
MSSIIILKESINYKKNGINDHQYTAPLQVGTIILYAGNDSAKYDSNFLLCDGKPYSNTEQNGKYSSLYNVIYNIYGGSSGNDFKVPNMQLNIPIGRKTDDNNIYGGVDKIENKHYKHNHTIYVSTFQSTTANHAYDGSGDSDRRKLSTGWSKETASKSTSMNLDANGDAFSENAASDKYFPPYCAINYLICYKS